MPNTTGWNPQPRLNTQGHLVNSLTDFFHNLFSKDRHKFFFDVCVSRSETFVSIDISDDGFDAGWVSE